MSCLERSFRKEEEVEEEKEEGFHIFLLDSKGAAVGSGAATEKEHISRKPIKTSALNNE